MVNCQATSFHRNGQINFYYDGDSLFQPGRAKFLSWSDCPSLFDIYIFMLVYK